MSAGGRALAVLVDGEEMPEAEGRALWERFSTWMEEHKGDLLGFAKSEGFASVHPGVLGGRPVLRASRTAAQQAYAPVREDAGAAKGPRPAGEKPRPQGRQGGGSSPVQHGGSGSRQTERPGQRSDRAKSRKNPR